MNHPGTISSKNSDLDATLIPLEVTGASGAHPAPFAPAPMANSAAAVTTIVEEDASTMHKQSQEFKLDSRARLELDKSFRNTKQTRKFDPIHQLFETDIINSIKSGTSTHPQFVMESEAAHKQYTSDYKSNMEQLGAMTISKYTRRKSNMKTFVAGAGLGM